MVTGSAPTVAGVRIGFGTAAFVGALLLASLLAGCGTLPVHASARPSPTSPTPPPASPPTGPLRVVGLGDSVTSGEHCDCDDYVTAFGRLLSTQEGITVTVANDGESGSTSEGLASELRSDDDLRSDVRDADVVVVTMGANDLAPALSAWRSGSCPASCSDPEVGAMQADLDRVLDTVGSLGGGRTRVLVTTYWNVFTDGDVARKAERSGYLAWSDALTRKANAAISTVAAQHGATLVDLYAPFKGDGSQDPTHLLAPDGDHPNAAGTALICRAVLAAYAATH
jgi:lysophospholipase L1-like esterase